MFITPGSRLQGRIAAKAFAKATVALFQQTAAPLFWTKITTYNDVGLRVVSGTASSVTGSTAFSTVFGQSATGAHTLTTAEMPAHTHTIGKSLNGPAGGTFFTEATDDGSGTANSGSTGGGGSHTHTISLQLNYVDVILASKN